VVTLSEGVTTNNQQKILPLNDDDQERLIEQRPKIENHLGNRESIEKYKKPAGKLGLLRALLETKVFTPDQTYELQCMGIVLGDVFVDDMGFRWVIVQDQYGRDPATQYKQSSIILYPLTMISKRIERGEVVDVFELYNGIAAQVEKLVKEKIYQGHNTQLQATQPTAPRGNATCFDAVSGKMKRMVHSRPNAPGLARKPVLSPKGRRKAGAG